MIVYHENQRPQATCFYGNSEWLHLLKLIKFWKYCLTRYSWNFQTSKVDKAFWIIYQQIKSIFHDFKIWGCHYQRILELCISKFLQSSFSKNSPICRITYFTRSYFLITIKQAFTWLMTFSIVILLFGYFV